MLPYEQGDLRQFLCAQLHPPLQRAWVPKCPLIPAQTPRLHHKNSPPTPCPPQNPQLGITAELPATVPRRPGGQLLPKTLTKSSPATAAEEPTHLAQTWRRSVRTHGLEKRPQPQTRAQVPTEVLAEARRGPPRLQPPLEAPPAFIAPQPSSSSELRPGSAAPSSLRHRGGNSDRIMKSCTVYYKKAIRQTAGWGPAPVT